MSKTKMQWLVDIGWEKHKIAGHYSRVVEFFMNMPDDISIEKAEELCKKLQDINLPLERMVEEIRKDARPD